MIAIFDVGNTNITIGFFKKNKLIYVDRIKTSLANNFTEFSYELNSKLKKFTIKDVFIGSVVPEITKKIIKIIKRNFNINPEYICEKTKLAKMRHWFLALNSKMLIEVSSQLVSMPKIRITNYLIH